MVPTTQRVAGDAASDRRGAALLTMGRAGAQLMKTPDKSPLIILGAGFFAQELADLVSDDNAWEVVGFVEGIDRRRCGTELLGLPVHWIDDLDAMKDSCQALCAVGSPARKSFIEAARRQGLTFTTFVHPTAHVSSTTILAEGTIVGPGAVVASYTTLGKHVIVNRGALIGHHSQIEDYATISPGANIAGKTHIGACTYVGMGAVIIDALSVGADCLVAAGAVVVRDVPSGMRVAGVPAREMKKST